MIAKILANVVVAKTQENIVILSGEEKHQQIDK
jgi:hypothetical protein